MRKGSIEAPDKESAVSSLQKKGLYVIDIEEEGKGFSLQEIAIFERVGKKDIVLFFRQLSIMFSAGIPIVEALKAAAEQADTGRFQKQITEVAKKVEEGNSLSDALEEFPETFSPFCLGIIKSGETSGKLSQSLDYLADHLERNFNFNKKVTSSLVYPAFVVIVFIGVLFFIAMFVIPQLGEMFEGMELPILTQVVLGISEWLLNFWWLLFGLLFLLVASLWQFFKTKAGRGMFDKIIFRTPLLGDFFKKLNLVSVAENLSTLLASDLPVVQAIDKTAGIITSETYKKMILDTKEEVKKGKPLSENFLKYPDFFPPLFTQMIVVGERTGRIDKSLENVVNFYQKEIDRRLTELVKLLEPIMIIFLGFFVALLIISILMPIYQLQI